MTFDYIYKKNAKIENNLQQLEILKQALILVPSLPHVEQNLRRQSILKSSLFSARIEGNRLEISDISYESLKRKPETQAKLEIANINQALNFLYSASCPENLTKEFMLDLHRKVMQNISNSAGLFRKETSAIFNEAGVAIYLTPPPNEIPRLVEELIILVSRKKDLGPVTAAVSHFSFEKIHPFLDGNGRVGRIISTYLLKKAGFDFRSLLSLEEYLDNNRETYYYLLNNNGRDITKFVEFFLEGMLHQARKALESIKDYKEEKVEDTLLPRRREILEIIRDHNMVSFDFIRRRFISIPESTLHYDLNKLLEQKFIRKLGNTRGAMYVPSNK